MTKNEGDTQELQLEQLRREAAERARTETALDELEAQAHARRAEKARYLREKLAQRAESEQAVEQDEPGPAG